MRRKQKCHDLLFLCCPQPFLIPSLGVLPGLPILKGKIGRPYFSGSFDHAFFRNSQQCCQLQGSTVIPDPYAILSRLHNPGRILFRIAGQLLLLQKNGKPLRLPWMQNLCFCKTSQFPAFLSGLQRSRINLNHLPPLMLISDVFYPNRYFNPVFFYRKTLKGDGKLRIRKPIAKRIQRLDSHTVKIPVSYINSFPVFFCFKVSIQAAEALGRRIILIAFCPGSRQPSAGSLTARQHICHCPASFLSGQADMQNCLDIFCLL